jgi:beta-lactamase class A
MTFELNRCSAEFGAPTDPGLQAQLEALDAELRQRLGMAPEHTAAGVLDLRTGRLALVRPDRVEYAASLPKIGILLAYFVRHPEAATRLDPVVRHELGLIAKASSNELAAKYSRELGLPFIQQCLNERGFYDPARGGGLWVGKHYGRSDERYPDPVGGHSHAATVRQVLRYFLLLEQGRLVSPAASQTLREIFASPEIPHDRHKFVLGLADRPVELRRKWGEWEDWQHDAAVVTGPGRHYVLVALTQHPRGDDYLIALAAAVDDWMAPGPR